MCWCLILIVAVVAINYATKYYSYTKPDSITLLNTIANSRSSSDLSRRRAERSSIWELDNEPEPVNQPPPNYRLISSPTPTHIRSALRKSLQTPPPTPKSQTATETAADSPALSAAASAKRRVRVIEPDVEALEALREYWTGIGTPLTGIGGYRRTRLFYSKSQGGASAVRRASVRRGVALIPGESDNDQDSSDDTSPPTAIDTPTPIGRPALAKIAVPTPPIRTSSLKSPTRTSKKRASSVSRSASSPTSPEPHVHLSSPQPASPAAAPIKPVSGRKVPSGGRIRGAGAAVKVSCIEDAPAAVGASSSDFEDVTTDTDVKESLKKVVVPNQAARAPPRVTVTVPTVVKPAAPPPAHPNWATCPVTAPPPTGANAVSASPAPLPFPRRTSSIPVVERPARMLGGRADSFGEPSARTLVA